MEPRKRRYLVTFRVAALGNVGPKPRTMQMPLRRCILQGNRQKPSQEMFASVLESYQSVGCLLSGKPILPRRTERFIFHCLCTRKCFRLWKRIRYEIAGSTCGPDGALYRQGFRVCIPWRRTSSNRFWKDANLMI